MANYRNAGDLPVEARHDAVNDVARTPVLAGKGGQRDPGDLSNPG